MNPLNNFQTGGLRFMINSHLGLITFFQYVSAYKITSSAPLLRLSSQLHQWNIERASSKEANQQLQDLCIEDIDLLREMIQSAITKSSVTCPEVFLDQLLFLVVGAIQIQYQTGSDKAWKQVNLAILNFLNSQNEKRVFRFSLSTMTFLICLSAITIMNYKVPGNYHTLQDLPVESISSGRVDLVTISTLQLAQNKMMSGTCPSPQVDMLPPRQREAFLRFIDEGVVDVHQVEDLRLALDYVNCLYPKERLHPSASDGNRL